MPEEDGGGAAALGHRVQRGVPGIPRGSLGPAGPADGHGDRFDGVEPEAAEPGDDFGGPEFRAVLESVVDGDAARADGEFTGLEGQGGGERHGVGATGARDQHQRLGPSVRGASGVRTGEVRACGLFGLFVQYVVEYAANRQAYRCDRRMGTHVRCPSVELGGCLG